MILETPDCEVEELAHTSEIGLRAQAPTLADLFRCLARAMIGLTGVQTLEDGESIVLEVDLGAMDIESLLVDWLNEVLYLHEVTGVVPQEITVQTITPDSIQATVSGRPAREPSELQIKAVTYHQLSVVEEAGLEGGGLFRHMITLKQLNQISEYVWEVSQSFRPDMRVPARVFASRSLLEQALTDRSMEQLINATTLPGVVGYAIAMPDVHQGYGFPVGGVAATALPHGVISPGSIGYDINCGVRLLASDLTYPMIEPYLDDLSSALYKNCPSGMGGGGAFPLNPQEMDDVLARGAGWCLDQDLATPEDLLHSETNGHLAGAKPGLVSNQARERGRNQLGTLGSGNHFLEVDRVTEIYDYDAAEAYGLRHDQITVLIHCGSRGLGHQVCTDYVRDFQAVMQRHNILLPDRELVCAPLDTAEGRAYLAAMQAAANFAFANRQVLAMLARESFDGVLANSGLPSQLRQVYDVAHNIAKIERHRISGRELEVCVHRKGATRAFAPHHDELPLDYAEVGQPVLVPGSMGTASYVLAGARGAMEQTFGSSCHGAGRMMSRTAAKKQVQGAELKQELQRRGIRIRAGSASGLAEEAPLAYKPIEEVIAVVTGAGIATAVARLEPVAVIKG